MKALVYRDFNDFKWEEVETPVIGPDEILVRVMACGLCSTDVWKAMYHEAKPGMVLGHEVSGELVETGLNVANLRIGDRVAVFHRAECGACYYCKHGDETLCSEYRRQSIFPGAFAEYIRVTPRLVQKSVVKIPDEMTYEEATMIEPTACCVRAVSKCGISVDDSVLIIGDGPMAMLNAQVSKSAGALVILSGHHDSRVEPALRLGADYAFNSKKISIREKVLELTGGRGADVVIVAVSSTDAVQQSLKLVREGGKICVFGDFRDVPQPSLSLDLKPVVHNGVKILGSWGCSTKDYHAAFNLLKNRKVRVKEMITHRFPLERFTEALNVFLSKDCLKIVLHP
ncbi:MAG: alcohol dehydrogenase catalytic domain-containing protein [Thaumarchaeota archaeon]|jgi:L-iditol 2-dehydrogenase|nr:alcohol dehydrogenase catalytic domain-containing protein [Nitrososphaerota archaeon]